MYGISDDNTGQEPASMRRAYDRQDTYNIRFESATTRVEGGFRFGWEGGPLVW